MKVDFRSDPPGPGASTRQHNSIALTSAVLALNLAALCLLLYVAVPALRQPLLVDDAFMFHRYAVPLRQGLGISWNPDGIPTGGMTSMGWFLLVIPQVLVLAVLEIVSAIVIVIAFFVVLFTGRWPDGMRNFVLNVLRWYLRVETYYLLLTDDYPPFKLEPQS